MIPLLIESDLIIAHLKKKDWLKPTADKIFEKIKKGELEIEISTEIFHELTYALLKITDFDTVITNLTYLYSLENVNFLPLNPPIYIMAIELMRRYNIQSVFDAIYAAQTLIQTKDKTILSTDHIYDKIEDIKRVDPREITKTK